MRRTRLAIVTAILAVLAMVPVATPAQADPLADAFALLQAHQVPIQSADGTPTYTGWGRMYLGPNGLELRLNSDATWNTVKAVTAFESLGSASLATGSVTTVGGIVLSALTDNDIRLALAMAGIGADYFGDSLARRLLLGNYCLGITVPTVGVQDALNRAAALVIGVWTYATRGTTVWFETCSGASSAKQDHVNTLVPPVILQSTAVAQPISYTGDRTILHSPNGSLYVMAGGAKFAFGSWGEFVGLGYSTAGMVDIDATTLASIPNVPRDGTVLRSGGGNIYVVAGGAKFIFGSWGEYTGQGYSGSSYINVPQSPLDQIGDAPGNMPANGTIIQHSNGNLYLIVGSVKFQFGTMSEYHALGYADTQIVRVSGGPADSIPAASTSTPPSNGTILRSGGGQVYVIAGGSKFYFGSMTEYAAQGYASGAWINVPQSPLDQIGDAPGNMPRAGTVVLRPDGALFVIAGGVRWHFGTMAEFTGEGYTTFALVPQAAVDGIYDASSSHLPAGETVFEGTGSTIWVMKAGVRRSFTSMAQFANLGYTTSQIVRVPDAVLNGLPSGGDLP